MAPNPTAEPFVRRLIDGAGGFRLPELFVEASCDALYHLPDRHGVSVVALRASSLGEEQTGKLMTYRLVQYVFAGQVDATTAVAAGWEQEPRSGLAPSDIHVLAGSAATGELLCYAVVRQVAEEIPPWARLRDRDRPLFPVEKVFGWGVYNRLRVLPDLPAGAAREFGRFVKNQRPHAPGEQAVRGPVEVGVALFRLLVGPLAPEVRAVVGEIEETVAMQNLDFFHAPAVFLRGAVADTDENHFLHLRFRTRACHPFAFLTSDLVASLPRLAAVEAALALPGKQGIAALLALKRGARAARSSAEPRGGLALLADAPAGLQDASVEARREQLDARSLLAVNPC